MNVLQFNNVGSSINRQLWSRPLGSVHDLKRENNITGSFEWNIQNILEVIHCHRKDNYTIKLKLILSLSMADVVFVARFPPNRKFLIEIDRCMPQESFYFWDIRLKIYRLPNFNMLFQLLVLVFTEKLITWSTNAKGLLPFHRFNKILWGEYRI